MNCYFSSLRKGTPCAYGCGRRLWLHFRRQPACECIGCAHLGAKTGEMVTATLVCASGKKSLRTFAISRCGFGDRGECLPDYQCDSKTKEAISESWQRSDAGAISIMLCRDCRANNLGFKPIGD